MMALLFIALAILTFIHFVYEGILAPSFRAKLRLDFFKLRDDLRDLKIARKNELSDEVFRDLQDGINGAVVRLNQIDFGLLKKAHDAFERDEKLQKSVARRNAMFDACAVGEVKEIRQRYFELLDRALMINSGGWFPYLVPIALALIFADTARNSIKNVFTLPENDLNRIAPPLMSVA